MLINKVNSVGTTIRNSPPPIFQPQTHLTVYEFSFHSTLLLYSMQTCYFVLASVLVTF